jgi:hypothetical protein
MTKELLWTFEIMDGKVVKKQQEYEVTTSEGGYFSVVSLNGGISRYNMTEKMFDRTYSMFPETVVANRREWLIERSLPEKMRELKKTTDEIEILSIWLSDAENF